MFFEPGFAFLENLAVLRMKAATCILGMDQEHSLATPDHGRFEATRWSEVCPAVPIQIETISGFARNFPYKQNDFWQHYDKRPDALAKFEALAKRGHAIPSFKAPEGVDRKKAEQDYQKGELERSITYLRTKIGLGLKA